MNRIARWRIWLASLLMGRRPRWTGYTLRAKGRGPVRPFARQPWMSPPEDELGVGVPVQGVLAHSDDVIIGVTSCVAFTSGFQLGVGIRKKREPPPVSNPRLHREMPEMSMEIGVRFSDGRQTTKSDFPRRYVEAVAAGQDPPPLEGPIIGSSGGGGGGRRWDWTYWVWPLPPDGRMTVSCHWPAGGVPDGEAELDGSAIRSAGERSKKLW